MVVKSLRHELQGQAVFVAGGLFNLGPLILEPDFNLGLVQVQFLSQRLSPLLRYVAVRLELGFQSLQLLGRERRPGPLVLLAALFLFQFPCPWAWCGNNNGKERVILWLDVDAMWQQVAAVKESIIKSFGVLSTARLTMSDDSALLSAQCAQM